MYRVKIVGVKGNTLTPYAKPHRDETALLNTRSHTNALYSSSSHHSLPNLPNEERTNGRRSEENILVFSIPQSQTFRTIITCLANCALANGKFCIIRAKLMYL